MINLIYPLYDLHKKEFSNARSAAEPTRTGLTFPYVRPVVCMLHMLE